MLFSMEVKVAKPWSCNILNSMEFHAIAGLTVRKCKVGDSMESFHTIAGLTLMHGPFLSKGIAIQFTIPIFGGMGHALVDTWYWNMEQSVK